jgi:hypothetical protein
LISSLLPKRSAPSSSDRGVFRYDEKLKRWVKKYDKPQEDGVYAMPLQEYQERKHHLTKGSWHRQPDPAHACKEALARDDFGRAGCKDGHGFHHPKRNGKCIYCGKTQQEIEKIWKKDGR